jgi:hypothetical protein
MKRLRTVLLASLILSAVLVMNADAKWWIFGTSEDEVETSYLYLNKVSLSEMGTKVTLYRDMLPDGNISIQGKGTAGKNKIGSVRITLDGKETWQDVKLSENGAFEFSFRPDLDRTYKLYVEVTDTTGKTNKVDTTYKEINISQVNIQAIVRDVLDKLIDAYQRENPGQFMALVADDFAGDKTILDRAIRKDFTVFDNIAIRYTLNNVTSDATGKVFAGLSYSRMVTSTRTGKSLSDKGSTEFTFKVGDRGLRAYSMKIPLIFGLSDASNVATGVVNQGTNEPVILVDAKGNVSTVPFNEAARVIGSGGMPAQSVDLSSMEGFIFSSATKTGQTGGDITVFIEPWGGGFVQLKNGSYYNKALEGQNIDTITTVPAYPTGYSTGGALSINDLKNKPIALRLPDGKYVVIQWSGILGSKVTIKYKYQPNGNPTF